MAVTSGFYNSVSGDRKYNTLQMSSIFDGIIEDGVYNSIGDRFSLTAGEGNTVIVGTGRAWFNHTWTLNDADYPLAIEPAEVVLNRYDAIVIEVNGSNAVRNNSIKVIKGTAGSSPSKPTMANGDDNIWQHPLGYIYVPAGSSSVSQSNIEYVVGTSECPFVVAAVQSVDIDALVAQWQDEFDSWFDNLEYQLSGDVAGNLQNQINQKVDKSDVIDDPNDILANQAEGMVAGAKAVTKLITNDYEIGSGIGVNSGDRYWYKKYNNGLIEYWGRCSSPAQSAGGRGFATIDFPFPFTSVKQYSMTSNSEYADTGTPLFATGVQMMSTSRAYIYTYSPYNNSFVTGAWILWTAKGFWK